MYIWWVQAYLLSGKLYCNPRITSTSKSFSPKSVLHLKTNHKSWNIKPYHYDILVKSHYKIHQFLTSCYFIHVAGIIVSSIFQSLSTAESNQ